MSRIDAHIASLLSISKSKAQDLIKASAVLVNGQPKTKCAYKVNQIEFKLIAKTNEKLNIYIFFLKKKQTGQTK